MDINNIIAEAKKRPDTTIALPMRRDRVGREKFFSMFECRRCGACCTTMFEWIEFTKSEFNQIKTLLPKGGRSKFHKAGNNYKTPYPCMFYSKKLNGCTIYEKRPRRCRFYPIGYIIPSMPNNLVAHTGCPAACETIRKAWDLAGLYGVRP